MTDDLSKLRELTQTLLSNGYLSDQTKAWKYAFDSVNDLVCIVNTNYKIKFINKSFLKFLNKNSNDLINADLKKLHSGNSDLLNLIESNDTCIDGICMYKPIQIKTKGKWISPRKVLIHDDANELIGYIFILQDITEQVEIMNELNEEKQNLTSLSNKLKISYERLKFMVMTVDGYIWEKEVSNLDSSMTYAFIDHDFCQDFYGINTTKDGTCTEAVGRTSNELIESFKSKGNIHSFNNISDITDSHCIKQGKPCEYFEMGYIQHELKIPEWTIISVRKTPLYNDEGECTGVLGLANNCSENALTLSKLLDKMIEEDKAVKLDINNEEAKCYWIINKKNEKDTFSHLDFP